MIYGIVAVCKRRGTYNRVSESTNTGFGHLMNRINGVSGLKSALKVVSRVVAGAYHSVFVLKKAPQRDTRYKESWLAPRAHEHKTNKKRTCTRKGKTTKLGFLKAPTIDNKINNRWIKFMILCSRFETAVQLLLSPQAKNYWRWKRAEFHGNGLGQFIWKLVFACHCIRVSWGPSSSIPNHLIFFMTRPKFARWLLNRPSHSEKLGNFQKIQIYNAENK